MNLIFDLGSKMSDKKSEMRMIVLKSKQGFGFLHSYT